MTARQDAPSVDADSNASGAHHPQDVIAGKYLLRRVIGIGGMGTVWAATNLDLDLDVALKVVNKGLCSEETRARLATEARAEAKVQHRGIVRVLDLGVTREGEPFLVMERLQGRSLGDLLSDIGHLDSKDAVRLMLPILEALAYVHERGIVHRDLKPDNVFLAEQCGKIQPKLVDFGIAKLGDVPVNRRHTGRGAVVGSPGYMAPEHARGAEVDHRADLFCAALVLYEAISGRSAFRGANYNELLRAVIEQELDPITKYGKGDAELARILKRALAKQPARRHISCRAFGRELAVWLSGHGETEDITGEPLQHWLEVKDTLDVAATTSLELVRTARGRIASKAGTGLASLRGVSLSTAGFGRKPGTPRRLAFVALAVSGFVGGFAATTALGFVPRPAPQRPDALVVPAAPRSAQADEGPQRPSAPIVTPVERPPQQDERLERTTRPHYETPRLRARPDDAPTSRQIGNGTRARPDRVVAELEPSDIFPIPKPPPSFGDLDAEPSSPPPAASTKEPPKSALTLPADPPPSLETHPPSDRDDLKDPYQ